ncbi:MAG: glycosyltransferase family 2 protein [Bacteroidales bacterium]|nr:glycosyltransferase family 2 protein [Bacteroidales bacterium]
MGFASAWLTERALFPGLINEAPDKKTGIIVVIPAFSEPGITTLLDSLAICDEPDCKVEILIIINAPSDADAESLENNNICIANIEAWKKKHNNCFFRLFVFDAGKPSIKGWGVGLARKTGMDEAVRRFDAIDKPEGAIVNLDADCLVETNYFTSICNDLVENKERAACSIYFEHPVTGNDFPGSIYKYIILYELHLRYYLQGLKYSGFPYAFHTVGSAIAVKAFHYIKVGGMNRRQAGEDFYFIQKLVPLGGYFALNKTTVFPSPRESLRVPFGTGPAITRLVGSIEPLLLTYNTKAFRELKLLFGTVLKLFKSSAVEIHNYYENLPPGLKSFINEKEWSAKISEISRNTSGEESFRKRFFAWFNMFRIVKYLNHTHLELFEKRSVEESASELLKITGKELLPKDPREILIYYRMLERDS